MLGCRCRSKATAPVTTGQLYINGSFYFDGNLTVGSSTSITYTGTGTIYLSGTVAFNGSSSFCGDTSCSTAWNPDVNGIIILAACWMPNTTGSSLVYASSGTYCEDINTTKTVQFGSYVATDYRMRSGSNMGPVLANTLKLPKGELKQGGNKAQILAGRLGLT